MGQGQGSLQVERLTPRHNAGLKPVDGPGSTRVNGARRRTQFRVSLHKPYVRCLPGGLYTDLQGTLLSVALDWRNGHLPGRLHGFKELRA